MIKTITVTNYLGDSLVLDLANPEASGFAIGSATGFGPSKGTINVSEMPTTDGALYNSSRRASRNIVLTLIFLPNPTIEDTRHKLYKYFQTKKKIKLEIETDTRSSYITGYVESNEINIFSKMESAQISIICPDPNFYDSESNYLEYSASTPNFEFPFEKDLDDEYDIEFGIMERLADKSLVYTGDIDTGIDILLHATGSVSGIRIYNTLTSEVMSILTDKIESLTGSGVVAGDDILIRTIKGDKYIKLRRNGVETNILQCIDKDSAWFQISRGDNLFTYGADSGEYNLTMFITSVIAYEGI